MKKIFNLIVWIGSLSILLLSCSNDETENDKKPDDNNMVTVSLAMTGDILEVEETPLSKAVETADIYGIQIYSSPKNEDKYEPYGSGIFLDKSKMQVKLFKDRKYKFEMTVFPDGEIENGGKYVLTGYKVPFENYVNITDSIIYDGYKKELGELSSSFVDGYGTTYKKSGNRMPIDRYYGKLVDYTPTENSTVNMDLKRVVAGLTFKVKGLTNQSALKIEIEESPTIEIKGDGATDEMTCNVLMCLRGENVEQFYDPYRYTDKWFENPIDEVPFKFTWTNGERTESFTQTVTMKRKMNYTFHITIPETFLVSNRITITEEDKTWDDDVTVDNIYFGDLTIENEEDLEAFRNARYTKVTGNLTVSDLTMKSYEFDILQTVDGNLTVSNVDGDLDGALGNLQYVGGDLKFLATKENAMNDAHTFKYLHKLQKIGGNFEISSTKINSFINLSFIHTPLFIHVGGDIILKNLPAFKSYCFQKTVLQNHTGQFIVSGNAYNPTKEQILAGECSIE